MEGEISLTVKLFIFIFSIMFAQMKSNKTSMKYFLLRSKSWIYPLKANDIKQLERMGLGKRETTNLNQIKLTLTYYKSFQINDFNS